MIDDSRRLVIPCNDFYVGRILEISSFLNADIVGAPRISGPRSPHAWIQNGKRLLENFCVWGVPALSKVGRCRLYCRGFLSGI